MSLFNTFILLFGFIAAGANLLGTVPWTFREVLNRSFDFVWCLSPYAAFGLLNLFFTKTRFGRIVVSASVFLLVCSALLVRQFNLHPDVSPKMTLLVPLYQNCLAVFLFLVCSSYLLSVKTNKNP